MAVRGRQRDSARSKERQKEAVSERQAKREVGRGHGEGTPRTGRSHQRKAQVEAEPGRRALRDLSTEIKTERDL